MHLRNIFVEGTGVRVHVIELRRCHDESSSPKRKIPETEEETGTSVVLRNFVEGNVKKLFGRNLHWDMVTLSRLRRSVVTMQIEWWLCTLPFRLSSSASVEMLQGFDFWCPDHCLLEALGLKNIIKFNLYNCEPTYQTQHKKYELCLTEFWHHVKQPKWPKTLKQVKKTEQLICRK